MVFGEGADVVWASVAERVVQDVHIASHIYSEGPVPSLPSAAPPFGLSNWPVELARHVSEP